MIRRTLIIAGIVILILSAAVYFVVDTMTWEEPMRPGASPYKQWKTYSHAKKFFKDKFIFPKLPNKAHSIKFISSTYKKDRMYANNPTTDDFTNICVETKRYRSNDFYWGLSYSISNGDNSLLDIAHTDNIENSYDIDEEMFRTNAEFMLNNCNYSIWITPYIHAEEYSIINRSYLSEKEIQKVEKTTKEMLNSMINSLIEQAETKSFTVLS